MDDDDDESCLFDLIGDAQALNYFLHGAGSKSNNEDLTNAGYSAANSNSIFANTSSSDPKSSIKGVGGQLGEGPSDGLQLPSSLQFLDDELESSPLPDLGEDQPFDILQKSLQEANITEQTLAEEAYLDANIGSNQQFAQTQLHPSSSASFTQASNVSNYSGQTLQPIGVTQVVQQPVGASFASNTVGVQHGFMQHVGISVPSQHLSNSSQIGGSGQIQLIGSFSNQPSMMTINNLEGSHIILKGSGQQAPANMSSGLLVHRQTPNGNSLFGNSNSSPVAQPVTVPFNSTNFQTSLPVHNIIIQRGLAPNSNKVPINIQPKPIQMGQQATYNVNSLGIQQHHVQQGIPFASTNSPQNSVVGPHMSVNIVSQQNTRKQVTSQATQKKVTNMATSISSSKSQDSLRQPQLTSLLGQDTGNKIIQQSVGTALPHPEKAVGSSPAQQNVQVDGHTIGQKRPAAKQLTKGAFILQQLQKDQAHAVTPDKSQFRSLNDAVQRLLSYHVCQGSMPTDEDLRKVDNEFESVATQLLKRTQAMLNKYRCLLLEDAMRINPSAEMVMIDRMFNQEERQTLSRDKRLAIVDPDGFLADFCCPSTQLDKGADETQPESDHQASKSSTSQNQTANAQTRDRSSLSTAESLNHKKLHVVPNNIVSPQQGSISVKKPESLTKALKFEKARCSPDSQCMAASEQKLSGKDPDKSNEKSLRSEGTLSKTLSSTDHGTHNKTSRNAADSHSQATSNHSLQDKTPQSSPKNEDLHPENFKGSGEPQKDLLLNKSLETTFKNIMELKKTGRQPQSEATGSGSLELEYPNFSLIASQENCLDKFIPDHSEGVGETDSLLEAAVNSILEC
ncbi:BRD4-interacting chromatin-remodeling complex-associated protein-like isoform X2 [Tiliqua scincoides]|uniref:BRD4-interacting chromatin-remodeling complex-associated protein-like isoform X2 n=1 Tax=Tiliqua scincoides TaxID=71010 RepID=UPI0034627A0B